MERSPRKSTQSDAEFGRKLRSMREDRNITQSALGLKLGVSFQQIQKYERGTNKISAARLEVIAKVFGIPITDFYASPSKSKHAASLLINNDDETVRMLRVYRRISDDQTQHRLVLLMEKIAEQYDGAGSE